MITLVFFWVIFGKWVTDSQQSLKRLTWRTASLMQGLKSQAKNWCISSDSAYVINRELNDLRMFRANQSLQMRKPWIVMEFEEEVWQADHFYMNSNKVYFHVEWFCNHLLLSCYHGTNSFKEGCRIFPWE